MAHVHDDACYGTLDRAGDWLCGFATLAELREPDGPWSPDNSYCPLCHCRKSGTYDDPNRHDDCCEDSLCPCHDEGD